MEWHLFKADEKRKKWSIRGTLFNGEDVKIPGHRDKKIAEELRRNIDRLNRAKAVNEPPPPEINAWLNNQPQKFVDVLIKYNLVDQQRLDRRLPLESFFPKFKDRLMANQKKTNSNHPKVTIKKVQRILGGIDGLGRFEDLTIDAVKKSVLQMKVQTGARKGQPLSTKTVREHYAALKLFVELVRKAIVADTDPLADLELPSAKTARVYNRRPYTEDEIRQLMTYLWSVEPNAIRDRYWEPRDRAMLYWAAVSTGFRQKELMSLTPANFDFEVSPATVTVHAEVAKNGSRDTIPIPADFAEAIKEYISHRLANAPAFRAPKRQSGITMNLHRDLDGAGVKRKFPNGDIRDFHTFRSTAICWWLLSGKNLLEVQFLARLKTLDLVQEYVRRYLPDYSKLVMNAPKITNPLIGKRLSG